MTAPASKWRDNVSTSILINAPVSVVYSILTDFPLWSEWNPLIQPITLQPPSSSFTTGARLTATLHLPGQSAPIAVHTYLQSVEPPSTMAGTAGAAAVGSSSRSGFSWGGYQGMGVLLTDVFYGHHMFELRAEGDGCRFTNCEDFSGLVVWVGRVSGARWYRELMGNTRRGFESMNAALKQRVEQQTGVQAAAK